MSEGVDAGRSLETCQRLLALAEAQTSALAAHDVEAFAQVTSERDALPSPLSAGVPAGQAPELRALLERVAALDHANLARARELLHATERELRQVRQGQAALRGYRRPGAHLTAEPTFLDQHG
jgi:multidrug resistance efflux pump